MHGGKPDAEEEEVEEVQGGDLFVDLREITKGAVGAAVETSMLSLGDLLHVRRARHQVVAVTGGGHPSEVYGAADFIFFDSPFLFNCRRIRAYPCLTVPIRAKHSFAIVCSS